MKLLWQLGILLLCPLASQQRSTPASPSYVGAVVEYSPIYDSDDEESVADLNAKNYMKFIEKAAEYSVDILVFPESSLSISTSKNRSVARSQAASYIPDPAARVSPCDDLDNEYAPSLKLISCAARKYSMYLVANHREKLDCVAGPDCPADGLLIYNSNVAFDREGRLIARYRKVNLFNEAGTNVTVPPELAVFETDFNVTFGTFICFDILFRVPALNYTRNLGVTDVVYSAHWFSELPYAFGVESQAAWAYANDVNFLHAGHNYPKTASGGSGIFIGRQGPLHVVSEDKASNVLIVSEIPKIVNGKRLVNISQDKIHVVRFNKSDISTSESVGTGRYLYKTSDLTPYTTELIDPTLGSYSNNLCDRGLCCRFALQMDFDGSLAAGSSNFYRYRAAVFNGTMSFAGAATGGAKVCGIIACLNDSLASCGKLFSEPRSVVAATKFRTIEISMPALDDRNHLQLPATIASNMKPLEASDFTFVIGEMKLLRPRDDLLTFAILGRNFAADGGEVTQSSATGLVLPTALTTVAYMALFVYF